MLRKVKPHEMPFDFLCAFVADLDEGERGFG
jgi:hypothetical protein